MKLTKILSLLSLLAATTAIGISQINTNTTVPPPLSFPEGTPLPLQYLYSDKLPTLLYVNDVLVKTYSTNDVVKLGTTNDINYPLDTSIFKFIAPGLKRGTNKLEIALVVDDSFDGVTARSEPLWVVCIARRPKGLTKAP